MKAECAALCLENYAGVKLTQRAVKVVVVGQQVGCTAASCSTSAALSDVGLLMWLHCPQYAPV